MNLTLSAVNAQNAYNKGTKEEKELLTRLYPEHHFNRDITEIVTSYEAACEVEGITPLTLADFSHLPVQDQDSDFASHQLNVICRSLNGDTKFDYADDNQPKWYIWFKWGKTAAGGSGFSLYDVYINYSRSGVGARHSLKSEKLARYAAKQFESIYNRFLKPYQS